MKMLLSGVKSFLAIFVNFVLWYQCRADCNYYVYPGDGMTCNVDPGDTSGLQIIVQWVEDIQGECHMSLLLAAQDVVYQTLRVLYTGTGKLEQLPPWMPETLSISLTLNYWTDSGTTSVNAISTAQLSTPWITGIYTFNFNIPNTAILSDSDVTEYLTFSAPSLPTTTDTSLVWKEVHSPTILFVNATSTSTYPVQVVLGILLYYGLPYSNTKDHARHDIHIHIYHNYNCDPYSGINSHDRHSNYDNLNFHSNQYNHTCPKYHI